MEFAIIAYDGTDEQALERRMAVREQHMVIAQRMRDTGRLIHGGAILDDQGRMIGSIAIAQFASLSELDTWLKTDPYIKGDVWRDIQVIPYKTAPPFLDNIRPLTEAVVS